MLGQNQWGTAHYDGLWVHCQLHVCKRKARANATSGIFKDSMHVNFNFQKVEEVNSNYVDIRTGLDAWFARLYEKILTLAGTNGSNEQRRRICQRQGNRENTLADTVLAYWKRTVVIPFLQPAGSFSSLRRIHTCLPNSMTTERLSDVPLLKCMPVLFIWTPRKYLSGL